MKKEDIKEIKKAIEEVVEPYFTVIQGEFRKIDQRFDKVEGRLDKIEGRLDKIEARLAKLEGLYEDFRVEVREIRHLLQQKASVEEFNELDARVTKIEVKLRKAGVL